MNDAQNMRMCNRRRRWALLLGLALIFGSQLGVRAQQPAATGEPTSGEPAGVDALLLEGLNAPAPTAPAESTEPPSVPLDAPPVGEDIGQPGEQHPLVRAMQRMRDAQQRLVRGDTSDSTQPLQRAALNELQALIDRLEQQAQQPQPSGQMAESPATESPAEAQQGESQSEPKVGEPSETEGEDSAVAETDEPGSAAGRKWGHLPPRVREQLESAAIERFLPQYEELIEAYYLRLAEDAEQPSINQTNDPAGSP